MNQLTKKRKIVPNKCRFCSTVLEHRFIDIAFPDNGTPSKTKNSGLVTTYVCSECFLIQMDNSPIPNSQERDYVSRFSSFWLNDMKQYINNVFKRFELTDGNLTTELSNHQAHSLESAQSKVSFGNNGLRALIDIYGKTDILICNNEMAYVDDINDFFSAIKLFLKPTGFAVFEFLHLLHWAESIPFQVQANTKFAYFSFTTIDKILKYHDLSVCDTEVCSPEGSIRVYAKHPGNSLKPISDRTRLLRGRERDKGMSMLSYYIDLKERYNTEKNNSVLIEGSHKENLSNIT